MPKSIKDISKCVCNKGRKEVGKNVRMKRSEELGKKVCKNIARK